MMQAGYPACQSLISRLMIVSASKEALIKLPFPPFDKLRINWLAAKRESSAFIKKALSLLCKGIYFFGSSGFCVGD